MSVREQRRLGSVAHAGDIHLAHQSIDLTDPKERAYLEAMISRQRDALDGWVNYRRIGEVRYSVSRSARIAGYARLKAVRVDKGNNILSEKDSGVEAEIVNSIYGRWGGVRGLIERYYTLMKVPGQSFLVRVVEGGSTDGYWFLSASELPHEGDLETLKVNDRPKKWRTSRLPGADGTWDALERSIAPKDFIGRIWSPDHEYTEDVSSPMQAVSGMCQQLHDLTESISGRLKSRFAHAGILLIPSEINDAGIGGKVPDDRQYSSDKVLNYFIHVMTTNVVNHAQGMAQIPIMVKGPSHVLDKLRHEIMDATIAETDLKLRSELVNRILTSLDQQKEATQSGENTSHWGMWAVSDEERRITVQPDLDAMCHALTRMILWPDLKAKGRNPGAILPWRVWYDLSSASVRSNMAEDGRQLHDRGVVGDNFLRTVSGATDEDKPTDDEYIRWVGRQTKNPMLMLWGLEGIEATLEEAAAYGAVTGPASDSPADPAESGPGVGDPGSPNDRDSDIPRSQEPG